MNEYDLGPTIRTLLAECDASTIQTSQLSKPHLEQLSNLGMFTAAVGYLSSFSGEVDKGTPFPFNSTGARYVEEYLQLMVGDLVTQWDDGQMTGMKMPDGSTTRDTKVINGEVNHRFLVAGVVFGQCLAQTNGWQWVSDDSLSPTLRSKKAPAVQINLPWSKPKKFCEHGREESLEVCCKLPDFSDQIAAILKKVKANKVQLLRSQNGNMRFKTST